MLVEDPEFVMKKEKLGFQKFACHCGIELKHTFDLNIKSNKLNCSMMQLDQELNINPYHCITHDIIVCCICAVVCHKDCTVIPEIEVNLEQYCTCISDFHSNFNEMAALILVAHGTAYIDSRNSVIISCCLFHIIDLRLVSTC